MEPVAVAHYGEIGTKSGKVQKDMVATLRQRVEDRLQYEGLEFEKVYTREGRIVAEVEEKEKAAEAIHLLPGVKTASPALRTSAGLEAIKKASKSYSYGESFGVDPNTGDSELSTPEIATEIGAHVQEFSGAEVDLESPETWLRVDVRREEAYVFTEKLEGPGGFPVGTKGEYAALISGGIDSPVAAYRMMTRGADILPIYFYNKPIAAEDHLARFKAALSKLEKFNPSRNWKAYKIDMEEVNKRLMEVGRGRIVAHRIVMFRTAAKIAEERDLNGLVTGESLGQKSSQTAENLQTTSEATKTSVYRPLLSRDKNSISQEAREIGTFEEAKINSACRSLSPENPATKLKKERVQKLLEMIEGEGLVEEAYSSAEVMEL